MGRPANLEAPSAHRWGQAVVDPAQWDHPASQAWLAIQSAESHEQVTFSQAARAMIESGGAWHRL
eukprot:9164634-Alexandrium_andersonii.AAC.1